MKYISEYCVLELGEYSTPYRHLEGTKFFVGDKVTIYKENVCALTGTITLITCKGIYLDVGNKKDKYFRLDEITEIY